MKKKNLEEYPLYRFKRNVYIMLGMKPVVADGTFALMEIDVPNDKVKLHEIHTDSDITLTITTFQESMTCINNG